MKTHTCTIFWNMNFWISFLFGFSFLGIGRTSATKILLIAQAQQLPLAKAQELYDQKSKKFDSIFEGTDLVGWVSEEKLKRLSYELRNTNIENL